MRRGHTVEIATPWQKTGGYRGGARTDVVGCRRERSCWSACQVPLGTNAEGGQRSQGTKRKAASSKGESSRDRWLTKVILQCYRRKTGVSEALMPFLQLREPFLGHDCSPAQDPPTCSSFCTSTSATDGIPSLTFSTPHAAQTVAMAECIASTSSREKPRRRAPLQKGGDQ